MITATNWGGAGTSAVTCLFRGRFRKPFPIRNGAGALKLNVAVQSYMGGEYGHYKAASRLYAGAGRPACAAALYHYFIRCDGVLQRMLPGR